MLLFKYKIPVCPENTTTVFKLILAMASCHSLIKLNGELTGNPLDVKVFESIGKPNFHLKSSSLDGTYPKVIGICIPGTLSKVCYIASRFKFYVRA